MHTLDPSSSGGVEPIETLFESDDTQGEPMTQNSHNTGSIPQGFGRITRDDAGQVLHIQIAEGGDEGRQTEVVPDMETLVDDTVLEKWTMNGGVTKPPINIVQGKFWKFS